jgi:hypothetical protein
VPTVLFSQDPTPHSRLANSLLWMARCQGEAQAAGLHTRLHFPWAAEMFQDFLAPSSPWLASPGEAADLFARISDTPLSATALAAFSQQMSGEDTSRAKGGGPGEPTAKLTRQHRAGVTFVWGSGEGLMFREALDAAAGADLLVLHEPFGFHYGRPRFPTKNLGPLAPSRGPIEEARQRQAQLNPEGRPACGLHIRRGDYAHWRDGEFFYPDAIWRDLCQQQLAGGAHVSLFSNEPQGALCRSLVDLGAHLCGGSAAEDLIRMMVMDQVIGPPSTFPVVARMLARFCLGRSLKVEELGTVAQVTAGADPRQGSRLECHEESAL